MPACSRSRNGIGIRYSAVGLALNGLRQLSIWNAERRGLARFVLSIVATNADIIASMIKLIIDRELITDRNHMGIGLPDGIDLEAAIEAGAVNVNADPLDWQNAIAEREGSLLIWWGFVEEKITAGLGIVAKEQSDDKRGVTVRRLRHAREEIPRTTLIGALDFGHELRQMAWLDGRSLQDAQGMCKDDRAWIIQSEPLLTSFSFGRWEQLRDAADKRRLGSMVAPKAAEESHSSKP